MDRDPSSGVFARPVNRAAGAVLCFVVCAAATYGATAFMTKAYRSTTSASFVESSNSSSSLLGGLGSQLGSLSALVGLDIQTGAGGAKSLALLRSRGLADKFLITNGVMTQICSRRLIRCESGYETDAAAGAITLRRSSKYLLQKIISIEQDERLGLVDVSVTWFDRGLAADWANAYLKLADDELRHVAIADAQSRRVFLERAAQQTTVLGVQQAIFKVLESQINAEMMANSRSDYAFHVVDPAVASDPREYVRPQKAVIALIAGLIAMVVFYLSLAIRAGRFGLNQ
jgi:hypothetical protein